MAVLTKAGKQVGCFIVHGLTNESLEVEPLARYLEQQGYVLHCSTLGYTRTDYRGLNHNDYPEIIGSTEKELKEFADNCDAVVIIGFSVGGLIGIHLAEKYKLDALITINTPIYFADFRKFVEMLQQRDKSNGHSYLNRKVISTLYTLFNFNRLIQKVKRKLFRLRCPVLVIQGKKDHIANCASACYIYDNIFGREKEIQFFPKSGHFIFSGSESPLVFIRVYQFIEKIMENKLLMEGYL